VVLETADEFGQEYVAGRAVKLGADEGTAKAFGQAVAMKPAARNLMTKTAPLILQKYGLAQTTPEFAFLAGMGLYVSGLARALARLEKLARKQAKDQNANPRNPNPNPAEKPKS
jgi:hypothetical protein